MSFNLVDIIKNQFSDQVLGQMSQAVGESPEATQTVIDSVIPAVLDGLVSQTASAGGIASLCDLVSNQDASILSNLPNAIINSGEDSLIDSGNNLMGTLFGGETASVVIDTISSSTGMMPISAGVVVSMTVPIVVSSVKVFMLNDSRMDQTGTGLVNMLVGQKDNITAALPSGFSESMNAASAFDENDSFSEDFGFTGFNTSSASPPMHDGAESMVEVQSFEEFENEQNNGSSGFRKLLTLIVLGAIAVFSYDHFVNDAMHKEVLVIIDLLKEQALETVTSITSHLFDDK